MLDEEIIIGCLNNDYKSQKALFDKYANKMKALCYRYVGSEVEAEDVLQEGFILVYTKLKNYKFEGSFEGWLRRIMINVTLRYMKNNKSKYNTDIDEAYDIYDKDVDIVSKLSEQELMGLLIELPVGYRVVFNMYVIEGYNHKEIGDKLSIGESTSRSQLAKAKKKLRKMIEDLN